MAKVNTVTTTPFEGQKPGTSGLRKKVTVFQQANYVENFVQATFDAITDLEGPVTGATLVLGGDGRFLCKDVARTILGMARANGFARVLVGQNGLLSTPAVSAIIRRHKARGGLILTASHNPGGPTEDFGMKYNVANGGPAPSSVTEKIFGLTTTITSYKTADIPKDLDLGVCAKHELDGFVVEIIDPVEDYLALLHELFDFASLRTLVASGDFKMRIDCMHGVAGPYATRILEGELGAPAGSVINNEPKEDFGGGHPDPNLTYAADLVSAMRQGDYDFGAAFDGDADRNMVLGRSGFFVTPSDSVAVIAANASDIPYLKEGLKGVARSMPTSGALDHVAKKLNVELHEVPTGWKFFGNLMDAGRLSICGEESFGTGSDHVREKDGVWAVLCWLSILAARKQTVEEVLVAHWTEFGRNYFTRYDYEQVSSEKGAAVIAKMSTYVDDPASIVGKSFGPYKVASVDNFRYVDPVDQSVTEKQGIRVVFEDGSRIIMRLSGTGSSGATIRMYVDSYVAGPDGLEKKVQDALEPLVAAALELSDLAQLTGRDAPTVIT
eukprot:m.21821 g.21821  ORF g.21821 m.21821 type:complete len:554 (-) comp6575_c0_seq1:125-1786(-)